MVSPTRTEQVSYPSNGREVTAALACPSTPPPWPAVVMIHELSGLSDHDRDVATRFAVEGYLALAPDLYANDAVFKSLSEHSVHAVGRVRHATDLEAAIAALNLAEPERDELRRAAHWDRERDMSTYVPDLVAAIEYLRTRPDVVGGNIGCVGFCWGGGILGQLLVAGADLAAAEIYYGEPPAFDKLSAVRCPIEAHYGTGDTVVGYKFAPDLATAMKRQGKEFSYFLYEDAPHAFFNDTGPRYRPEAAKLAWERTVAFFARHLQDAPVSAT